VVRSDSPCVVRLRARSVLRARPECRAELWQVARRERMNVNAAMRGNGAVLNGIGSRPENVDDCIAQLIPVWLRPAAGPKSGAKPWRSTATIGRRRRPPINASTCARSNPRLAPPAQCDHRDESTSIDTEIDCPHGDGTALHGFNRWNKRRTARAAATPSLRPDDFLGDGCRPCTPSTAIALADG
jgi:hypothetical protein